MGKAILILDMPSSCANCEIRFSDSYSDYCPCLKSGNYYEDVFDYSHSDTKPDWCPLKAAPEQVYNGFNIATSQAYTRGYNACIDEILKGSEV